MTRPGQQSSNPEAEVYLRPFHLHRYLDEQAYRFNERKEDDSTRFLTAMQNVEGHRLPYSKLTGKYAPQLWKFAQGIDDRPVIPEQPEAKSYGEQQTFGEEVTDEPSSWPRFGAWPTGSWPGARGWQDRPYGHGETPVQRLQRIVAQRSEDGVNTASISRLKRGLTEPAFAIEPKI